MLLWGEERLRARSRSHSVHSWWVQGGFQVYEALVYASVRVWACFISTALWGDIFRTFVVRSYAVVSHAATTMVNFGIATQTDAVYGEIVVFPALAVVRAHVTTLVPGSVRWVPWLLLLLAIL